MPEIIVIDTRKPQETNKIILTPETELNQECLLGRDEHCSIVLNDSLASRTHAKIAFRNGRYYFSDLGSKNGSKINKEDAQLNQEYPLKPSDTIAIGNHLLWIKAIAGMQVAEPPQSVAPVEHPPLATSDPSSLETRTQETKQIKCVQIIDETADVKTFTFVSESPVKFDYQPGQYITLNLNINGQSVKYSYPLSSTPSRPHNLEITVKRVFSPDDQPDAPQELVSNWLHNNLKVGSKIEINAPTGEFGNFVNSAAKVCFISASDGIAPMMSMSRWLCDTVSNVDIIFIHSASSPEDIIFRQELEMMATRYPNFKLAITVTRPVAGQPWYGYTGRINETILSAIAPDYLERTVYVCGSYPFMEAMKSLLQKLNFPMTSFYEYKEHLGGKKQRQKLTPTIPAENKTSILQPTAQIPAPESATSILQPTAVIPPSSAPESATSILQPTAVIPAPESVTSILQPTAEIPPPPESATSILQPTAVIPPPPAPESATSILPPESSTIAPTSIVGSVSTPAPTPTPTPTPTSSSPTIVLVKSGQEIACDGKEPILFAAEAEGADLPFGCRMGMCGACKVRKLEGEVIYDDDFSCEEGYILTCVAKPAGRVAIEV
jgi:glycine betaine catabolism B